MVCVLFFFVLAEGGKARRSIDGSENAIISANLSSTTVMLIGTVQNYRIGSASNVRNHWSVSTNFVQSMVMHTRDNLVFRRYRT